MQIGLRFPDHDVKELIKREASKITGVPEDELSVYMGTYGNMTMATVAHIDLEKDLYPLTPTSKE